MNHEGDDFKSDSLRKWQRQGAAVLTVLILSLEFIFDIELASIWRTIVVTLDYVLIAGFVASVVYDAINHQKDFAEWLFKEKLNLFLAVFLVSASWYPRSVAAILIARILIVTIFELLDTRLGRRISSQINLKPSQTLALSFVWIIVVGTILLTFPAATTDGKGTPIIDALFTITSAACITGLMVVDVGTYFTFFGQAVILTVIQIGGLGIMVLSATFAILVGGHLPTRKQSGLSEILDVRTVKGLKSLILAVALTTLVMEFIGALSLFILWSDNFDNFPTRLWWSIFHAISAFCNAGIGLAPDSLARWVNDPWVSATVMILITAGGIGFIVIADLSDRRTWKVLRPAAVWNRLHVQSKIVLLSTLILNISGMLIFLFIEYDGALKGLSVGTKINAAIFQSVSLRTAGFSVVSLQTIAIPTILFSCVWMFIGASPGSCAGGVKTTTAAVCLMSVRSMLRGRDQVEIFGRRVSTGTINRSLSIILIAVTVIIMFLMFLTGTQSLPFEKLLFEVLSAFGTVGLSMDLTPQLDNTGRLLISGLMYIGRIGPLTMALALGQRFQSRRFSVPEARIAVG